LFGQVYLHPHKLFPEGVRVRVTLIEPMWALAIQGVLARMIAQTERRAKRAAKPKRKARK
jgi:hypothetical protein